MKQRGFHMFLEQNICVCHLLLKSSFVEKGCKSLGSLITSGFSYIGGWDCGDSRCTAKRILVFT